MDANKIATKKYGQNFLQDTLYIDKIIQSMPEDNLPVAEIGPGLGDLTRQLLRAKHVRAFEIDTRLCGYLQEQFCSEIEEQRLELVCNDVMHEWSDKNLLKQKYHLVANLPYYIATNLIIKALHDTNCCSITTMVQLEVAQKFSAKNGKKNFSALSVLAQSCGEAEILFEVPPYAFTPPPKVVSAVLSIRKSGSLDDLGFERFLKEAFKQPRKKLIKNLSGIYDKQKLLYLFELLSLDPNARPHEVVTSVYHRLYNELTKEVTDGEQQHTTTELKSTK